MSRSQTVLPERFNGSWYSKRMGLRPWHGTGKEEQADRKAVRDGCQGSKGGNKVERCGTMYQQKESCSCEQRSFLHVIFPGTRKQVFGKVEVGSRDTSPCHHYPFLTRAACPAPNFCSVPHQEEATIRGATGFDEAMPLAAVCNVSSSHSAWQSFCNWLWPSWYGWETGGCERLNVHKITTGHS